MALTVIDSTTYSTDLGALTLAYEGEQGSKVWTWRDEAGEVIATQQSAREISAYVRSVNGR